VLRIGRGLRLLRLVTALPKLQLLVGALLRSLGAMGYVGLLLALMFYMYAVAGVHLLGPLDPVHFGSLPAALLSLFRVITLDNWSDLLRAVQAGAPLVSVAYFVSFILLGTMIMLNLFIGIIMNSMAEMHAEIAATERPAPTAPDRDGHSVALADDLAAFERDIEALRQQAARIRSRLTLTPAEGAFSHGNHPGKRD
jgi:voltage-gated sodium channel